MSWLTKGVFYEGSFSKVRTEKNKTPMKKNPPARNKNTSTNRDQRICWLVARFTLAKLAASPNQPATDVVAKSGSECRGVARTRLPRKMGPMGCMKVNGDAVFSPF